MSERDELAQLIANEQDRRYGHPYDEPRQPPQQDYELADALLAAGYHKCHEEWGIRYEVPNPPFPGDATRTIPMPDQAHALAALQTGAPLHARNRRTVHRYITDWTETR